jgi:hypothetical protein
VVQAPTPSMTLIAKPAKLLDISPYRLSAELEETRGKLATFSSLSVISCQEAELVSSFGRGSSNTQSLPGLAQIYRYCLRKNFLETREAGDRILRELNSLLQDAAAGIGRWPPGALHGSGLEKKLSAQDQAIAGECSKLPGTVFHVSALQ